MRTRLGLQGNILKRGQKGEVVLGIVIAVLIVCACVAGWFAIGWAAEKMAEALPDEVESRLFGSMAERQPGWLTKPQTKDHRRALLIFNKFKKTPGLRKLDYKLYFVKEKTPNAFAMPGGAIGVTDGLLSLVKGEIGLANVIGHEFGHLQHRHSLEGMGHSLLIGGVLYFIVGGDAGILVDAALSMADRAHSRSQEREADHYGLRLVHKTYGTTKGALEFFQKLAKDPETRGDKLTSMLSTHPYTPDRIEEMKKLARRLEKAGE